MPLVTVLIVNYNSGDRLVRCLNCLKGQSFQDFDVVVIDNASSDDSIFLAQNEGFEANFVDAGENIGFAAANNRAASAVKSEWLAFLNPDAYPEQDWLEVLVAATQQYPSVSAFGSTQLDAANPLRLDGVGDAYFFLGAPYRGDFGASADNIPDDGECFSPCAAAALFRRDVFSSLDGFDENFFCYGEDVDLGFRLRLDGGRCIQVKNAVVLHEGSGIVGRHSAFATYYGHRNRIWLHFKNMPGVLYWPMLPFHLILNLGILFAAWRNNVALSYLRGVKDGYLGLWRLRHERARIQSHRKVKTFALLNSFTWSVLKFLQRKADIKPINRTNSKQN